MVMLDVFAPASAERFRMPLRRATGIALVLVLHAIALFLLMTSTALRTAVPAFVARETELILLPKPRAKKPVVRMPVTRTPSPRMPGFALPPIAPDMSGVGRSLFGCLGQTGCSSAPLSISPGAMEASPLAPHSLVLDEAHWEAQLAQERTPVRVPCTGVNQIIAGGREEMTALMVDPLCIINRMFGLDLGKM